ncbi:MAG: hypothetical protein AB3N13_08945, partial [Arenibacterium sp.]
TRASDFRVPPAFRAPMSPINRSFPKKPAKTLSEDKSRAFPHSLGSLLSSESFAQVTGKVRLADIPSKILNFPTMND